MSYEYKVVPAPTRGVKAKGVKTPEDRFANALETAMNTLAADGWEYLRADTLPSEQREGLMSKTTVFQNMLVFRRAKVAAAPEVEKPTPQLEAPRPTPAPAVSDDEPLQIGDEPAPEPDAPKPAKPEVAAQ